MHFGRMIILLKFMTPNSKNDWIKMIYDIFEYIEYINLFSSYFKEMFVILKIFKKFINYK